MKNIKMIFGAPGCGKTTYLITLLEELLKTYAPDEIAFVSFTKKGSYEGRDRAMEKFGYKEKDFPFFRTIHSLSFRALGFSRNDVINKKQYRLFSEEIGMKFQGYYTQDFINNDDMYLFYNSLRKNNPVKAREFLKDLNHANANRVVKLYKKFKDKNCIIDYDDMVHDFVMQDLSIPVKVAIIDEAQDLTTLQWRFCTAAFRDCEKVYIAGDDDQAIYEWSGADIPYFLNLTKTSRVTVLDKSYRLKENILDLSKKISSKIETRIDKNFDPVSGGGGIHTYNGIGNIEIKENESYYFLARNNYYLMEYRKLLMKKGLVFYNKGELSVRPKVYNAIRRYESLRKEQAFQQIKGDITLSEFLRKDKSGDIPWYEAFNLDADELNYLRDVFKNKRDVTNSNIHVSTIHGVKGGEADNVVLRMNITRATQDNLDKFPDSERRCLYVALTRAKENIHLVYSNSKFGYDNIVKGVM